MTNNSHISDSNWAKTAAAVGYNYFSKLNSSPSKSLFLKDLFFQVFFVNSVWLSLISGASFLSGSRLRKEATTQTT